MQLRIKETLENYRRVLQIARKPDKEEFIFISKVCGVGIILVGVTGFVLYIISTMFIG